MAFKLFYADYKEDKHVRSDEAEPATLEVVIEHMNALLHEPENFIGIIDDNEVMLQFMVEEDGALCVDAPVEERKGSHTKIATLDEAIDLVKSLKGAIDLAGIEGLEFQAWGR